jgi:protein-S-isoprenylcysteine O-methyltransferase Ste14
MEGDVKEKAPFWFPVAPIMVIVFIYLVLFLSNHILGWLAVGDRLSLPFFSGYILGLPLILIGVVFFIWGFSQLRPAAAIGFAKKLRDTGAYGLTRNPMYFGLNAAFWGVGLVLDSTTIVLGALIWSFLNYLSVTIWEEKQMFHKFGEEYLRYKKRVPKFIPNKINTPDRKNKIHK